jgi:hypothetical protein
MEDFPSQSPSSLPVVSHPPSVNRNIPVVQKTKDVMGGSFCATPSALDVDEFGFWRRSGFVTRAT